MIRMSWNTADVTLVEDPSTAHWVKERLLPVLPDEEGVKAGSIVPPGFDAYGRIFHPAHRYISETRRHETVRWTEIAFKNGLTVHPEMQFHSILGKSPSERYQQPEWGSLPSVGRLDPAEIGLIAEVLAEFTKTPELCYFCIWEGSSIVSQSRYRKHHVVEAGGYEYLVFRGRLDVVPVHDSPNIWWPEDRAWCVASDIDAFDTLVGGSRECIARLIAHPGLEVLPIGIEDRIDGNGDTVNTQTSER